MDRLRCEAVRRHLPAWHDRELAIDKQIAVEAHLAGCRSCAEEAGALRAISTVLRAAAAVPLPDAIESLSASVVSRIEAERELSLTSRVGRMFEDMHLVWAGLAATAATGACVLAITGLIYFAFPERADSLSAIITALASPGSNMNPVRPDGHMLLPRVPLDAMVPTMLAHAPPAEEEMLFALAGVVTREGRVAELEVLRASERDRGAVVDLLNTVAAARFEPARMAGAPVAVNMVWLVTHRTVRGRLHG